MTAGVHLILPLGGVTRWSGRYCCRRTRLRLASFSSSARSSAISCQCSGVECSAAGKGEMGEIREMGEIVEVYSCGWDGMGYCDDEGAG